MALGYLGNLLGVDRPGKHVGLYVGSQQQQIHDLGQASPRDVAKARKVGIIPHLAAVDHFLELDGEGHESGDPRNSRAIIEVAASVVARSAALAETLAQGQCHLDLNGSVLGWFWDFRSQHFPWHISLAPSLLKLTVTFPVRPS